MPFVPEIVYHYTTVDGLFTIISENQIWATDIEFLNDAEELLYARDPVLNEIEKRASNLDPKPEEHFQTPEASRASILRNVANYLKKYENNEIRYHHVYVSCFCEEGDLLSQWRAYGSEGGYALGFRTDKLMQVTTHFKRSPVRLEQIIYGIENAWEMLSSALDRVATNPTAHPGTQAEFQFGTLVLPQLALIKHPSFLEEKEWRLIIIGYTGDTGLSFRPSALGLVPYTEVALPADALVKVVVGPGNERDLKIRRL